MWQLQNIKVKHLNGSNDIRWNSLYLLSDTLEETRFFLFRSFVSLIMHKDHFIQLLLNIWFCYGNTCKTKILGCFRSSMLWHACARTNTHAKMFKSVINCMRKSNLCTFLVHVLHVLQIYMFLPNNCLCLIKICAYSHVTIKQAPVVDY